MSQTQLVDKRYRDKVKKVKKIRLKSKKHEKTKY